MVTLDDPFDKPDVDDCAYLGLHHSVDKIGVEDELGHHVSRKSGPGLLEYKLGLTPA